MNSGSEREFLFSFSLLVDQGERTESRSRVTAAALFEAGLITPASAPRDTTVAAAAWQAIEASSPLLPCNGAEVGNFVKRESVDPKIDPSTAYARL